MQLYDATNKRALCQKIDRLCDSNDTSYPRLDKTAELNDALERVISVILTADGMWQFDDETYTTNPIGTSNLTSGQNLYSFADKFLAIEEIAILDLNGKYIRIKPIDSAELNGMSFDEFFGIANGTPISGFPEYYDKQANSIRFDKAPTATFCTLTAGLRVRFKRTANAFTPASNTTADTTEPGFASPFHEVLAYMASIPYCIKYKKDRVAEYQNEIDKILGNKARNITGRLVEFYANREKDANPQMTMAPISFR